MNRTILLIVSCIAVTFVGIGIYQYSNKSCIKAACSSDLVLLNVLDAELYDDCRIPGSINLTLDELSPEWCKKHLDHTKDIVIYCSNYQCATSEYVAKKLKEKEYGAYERVYVYEGGIAEWYQQGYPVEGACKQSYLSRIVAPMHDETMQVCTISLDQLADKLKVTKGRVAV